MDAVLNSVPLSLTHLRASSSPSSPYLLPPRFLSVQPCRKFIFSRSFPSKSRIPPASSAAASTQEVECTLLVKPTTTVDEALELLVENRITGFPVIDEDWKLVGLVSDYDLLALDCISGSGRTENSMFPEVYST
ncbi:CBS domain [Arabidopsis thaliana x Arabidopsis arenosa]|uniref:CBS domain n=1 Tax=Arabidopsis thaliana x Arabidopsis arenosa TaxID=1240361 RepID=A0A8T1YBJ3_9BRAS|nr:CBS domain [Arabidopsis thaliana x Arabidopsis arenosa]